MRQSIHLVPALALLLSGCGFTPLTKALRVNSSTESLRIELRRLLDEGANVNEPDSHGMTPLMVAATSGGVPRLMGQAIELSEYLIERGADIEAAYAGCKRQNYGVGKMERQSWMCLQVLEQIKAKRAIAAKPAESPRSAPQPAQVKVPTDIDSPSFSPAQFAFNDNDLAVVIGIEKYKDLPKSDYSKADAALVKDYLKALGIPARNINLLLDEDASLSGITKSVEAALKNKVKPFSRVLLYFSGHGAPEPKTGDAYLVPYDGDPNYLEVTGYSLKCLYDSLGRLSAAETIILLDSCFSGSGGRSVIAKGARPLVTLAQGPALPGSMAVLSATQGSQISSSSPDKGHGLLTYYFLKGLREGKKDLSELYEYAKPLVENEAKELNVEQSPSLSPSPDQAKGRFVLRK